MLGEGGRGFGAHGWLMVEDDGKWERGFGGREHVRVGVVADYEEAGAGADTG